jgi:hypothetical protein
MSLESFSYADADACPFTKCLCNLAGKPKVWETTRNINNGTPLPKPIIVPLPPLAELERLAALDTPETLYEKQILNELKTGRER